MTKKKKKQGRASGPAGNFDYVEHGSEEHALRLGLKHAEEEDEPQRDGWALADLTLWGPNATDKFLAAILRQYVNELTTPPQEPQSDDPSAPAYAPPMWLPKRGASRL